VVSIKPFNALLYRELAELTDTSWQLKTKTLYQIGTQLAGACNSDRAVSFVLKFGIVHPQPTLSLPLLLLLLLLLVLLVLLLLPAEFKC
jgi:hypothetical protein